jgi:hypothetical protein
MRTKHDQRRNFGAAKAAKKAATAVGLDDPMGLTSLKN